MVHTIAPPPLPEGGTREDGVLIADLNKRIDEEYKVVTLRRKCLDMSKQLKGEEDGWVEVLPTPLELMGEKKTEHNLVARMQGAKGLGVERVFWDRGENKLVAVIWLGGSLCGWPAVIHGGAVAIALTEKLSLAAALANNSNSDALAAATPQQLPGFGNHAKMLSPANASDEPSQLSLRYVKPTYANQFFVIRVVPASLEELDPKNFVDDAVSREAKGGTGYEATLETLEGKACAIALATFAPSATTQLSGDTAGSAKLSVAAFRQWMWPSRSEQSQMG